MLSAATTDERAARSLIDWWTLAGVEWDYAETPNDWLAEDQPVASPAAPAARPSQDRPAVRQPVAAAAPQSIVRRPDVPLPDDLATFQQMWLAGTLGEDGGSGPRIAPSGPVCPRVMVLADAPVADDMQTVMSGKTGVLLDNILRSCGIDSAQVYRASFFPRIVLDSRAEDVRAADWKRIALHHIGLVRPELLVIAGENTGRTLLGHDLPQKPPVLHFLNHGGQTIKTVVTRKLSLMLHRSADEKSMAWDSWQLLLVE